MHNDATKFGFETLSDEDLAISRRWLGLDDDPDGTGSKKKKQPDASLLLPLVSERAHESDEYWAPRISGLHPAGHALGFRALYLSAFRTTSRSVHTSIGGLGMYITEKRTRQVVHRGERRPSYVGVNRPAIRDGVIAAQETWWLDEAGVRELVDRATRPARKARTRCASGERAGDLPGRLP